MGQKGDRNARESKRIDGGGTTPPTHARTRTFKRRMSRNSLLAQASERYSYHSKEIARETASNQLATRKMNRGDLLKAHNSTSAVLRRVRSPPAFSEGGILSRSDTMDAIANQESHERDESEDVDVGVGHSDPSAPVDDSQDARDEDGLSGEENLIPDDAFQNISGPSVSYAETSPPPHEGLASTYFRGIRERSTPLVARCRLSRPPAMLPEIGERKCNFDI